MTTPFNQFELYSSAWDNHRALCASLGQLASTCARGESAREEIIRFRDAFVLYGSATEGNLRAAANVEFSFNERDKIPVIGLRLAGSKMLLSNIIYRLEDIKPPCDEEGNPLDISQEDWEDAMRLIGNILRAFEVPLFPKSDES